MTSRAVAARYAKALFDVALKDGDIRAVETELAAFADLVAGHAELWRALTSPGVPVQKKQGLVTALVERGGVSPVVGRTLALLAARDRLGVLPDLVADYRARLLDREGIVRAEITTAEPVSPERVRQIEQTLARATGKQVTMAARVDASILGGVVARIGGTVYDGSIAMQLRKVREVLAR
jgi:F-type H+-transporting ATPase subunit delta